MLIYLCLLIPLFTVIVLSVCFSKAVVWWERILVFGAPIIVIFVAKQISVVSQTRDTEYWNTYGVRASYYEYWETWVKKTCQRCHTECTGSGDDRKCHEECEDYDCSYCDHNGPYWELIDNSGNVISITSAQFEYYAKLWGNKTFRDMNRQIRHHFGCGKDGDTYDTYFKGEFEKVAPIIEKHMYENRVKCSRSVFNFQDVDSVTIKDYGLYDFPENYDRFNFNPIMGWNDPSASLRLQRYNGLFGVPKQVHMWILVFKNKSIDAAVIQEMYWKGGNKNEFTLCLGINDQSKIMWAKVISWTEMEELKIRVARKVKEMSFDLNAIIDTMALDVQKNFIRKRFRDFNYLTVEPTTNAVITTFIITFLLCIGLAIFVIKFDSNKL